MMVKKHIIFGLNFCVMLLFSECACLIMGPVLSGCFCNCKSRPREPCEHQTSEIMEGDTSSSLHCKLSNHLFGSGFSFCQPKALSEIMEEHQTSSFCGIGILIA